MRRGRWDRGDLFPSFDNADDRDGMELSISGSGYRATINSYMYGDRARHQPAR